MLARGELQTVGATTLEEYRKYLEKDSALERRFQPIQVDEPTVADTIQILEGLRDRYEDHHQVSFTDQALVNAANLADRYIADRFLPDKAIDLIDEAGSRMRLKRSNIPTELKETIDRLETIRSDKREAVQAQQYERAAQLRDQERTVIAERDEQESTLLPDAEGYRSTIDEEEIAEVLAQWTGIPVHRLTEEETTKLLNMEDEMHKRIVGQHDAIVSVSKSIRRTRAGLADPKRPAGSFIFLGPSGVGKTESAKGQLTEAVRRKPFSVVLFDEIEKAHPDVFNILLQILEDGRLTDSQGRSVDFKNTVIIMTSNLGTAELRKKKLGFSQESDELNYTQIKEKVMEALKGHFRPEFLNRIDEVIVFHELTLDEVKQIVDLLLKRVREQLASKGLDIVLTDEAKELLAHKGYDPQLGARPLRRAIQQLLEDPLSERVLYQEFAAGSTILIDVDGDSENELTFNAIETPDLPPVELADSDS
jgi:ATP-dependent Clp protease ATP-binding subunit ClpC